MLVDFLISNHRHHPEMIRPVIEHLVARGVRCRVVSLCEFRGLPDPGPEFRAAGIEFRSAMSRRLPARSATGAAGRPRPLLRAARHLAWRLFLRRPLQALLASGPDLVVLPNDAAYPYERISAELRARRVPMLLLQEGIRFPLPGVPLEEAYGRGGARAIAAWGETSARYFREVGVAQEVLHLTGSPRFDGLAGTQPQAEHPSVPGVRTLLLLTNPIDDQGFCTKQAKLKLVARFVERLTPLLESGEVRLQIKFHAGESPHEYERHFPARRSDRIEPIVEGQLVDLLTSADAGVILTSTVGLEALLLGLPLAVLEIPGHGYVHDFVREGVAVGLPSAGPIEDRVRELLATPRGGGPAVRAYLERSLAHRGHAAARVGELIMALLESGHGHGG